MSEAELVGDFMSSLDIAGPRLTGLPDKSFQRESMVWEFQCPVNECMFSTQANEESQVIESAQDHTREAHDLIPSREEVEQYVIGPG
jgi:predicted small metal-binding protein